MKCSGNYNQHYTEKHPDVLSFLRYCFAGAVPYRVRISFSGDVVIGGKRIEIKSCNEWNITNHASGRRRRGRFHFKGHENADMILFVLVKEDGQFLFHLDDAWRYPLGKPFSLNWKQFFGGVE